MSKPRGSYTWQGKPILVADLAAMAGCTESAMNQRLLKIGLTVEQAVAAGPSLKRGREPSHTLDGKPMFIAELARLAGCTKDAMRNRLRKMTPEQAVAGGATMIPAPKPAPRLKPARPVKVALPKPKKPAVAWSDAPAIELPHAKRTIAPTPRGRFEADQPPPRVVSVAECRPWAAAAAGSRA